MVFVSMKQSVVIASQRYFCLMYVYTPQFPLVRQSLPSLPAFQKGSTVSSVLTLSNIKVIWVNDNIFIKIKSDQLSLPLPRGNPCRAFCKEVLKGKTADALLKKASYTNKNTTIERQFPVSAEFTKAAQRGTLVSRDKKRAPCLLWRSSEPK